jgi:hypothetical protein
LDISVVDIFSVGRYGSQVWKFYGFDVFCLPFVEGGFLAEAFGDTGIVGGCGKLCASAG